jgi:hypothetical protein
MTDVPKVSFWSGHMGAGFALIIGIRILIFSEEAAFPDRPRHGRPIARG